MPKTTAERIAEVQERKQQMQNQIKRLQQQQKSEERKARTHRLCKRGGIVEKLLPELATFTDKQFDIFVKKVLLTEHTKRAITDIAKQNPTRPANPQGDSSVQNNNDTNTATSKPTEKVAGTP